MNRLKVLLVLGTVLGFSPIAHGASISTLYNTGVDSSGNPLADGSVGDPHYVLTAVPGGTNDILVRTSVGGFPIPPYLPDSSSSAWIGPNNDHELQGPVGDYSYKTTFDLSGFDPSSALIHGTWSTDNEGVDILLNGIPLGTTTPPKAYELGFFSFSISSGFVAGLNELEFIIHNTDGPTALRVEMNGTVDAVTIPEPSSLMLLLIGICGSVAWRRRWSRTGRQSA